MNNATSTVDDPQYQAGNTNNYSNVSSESEYNISEEELTKKSRVVINRLIRKYNLGKNYIFSNLNKYDATLVNYKNIVDLYEWHVKENEELKNQLKKGKNDILTNERKTYYEDQQNEILNYYYYYFLFTVYFIIVICFGILSLIYPSAFAWKIRVSMLLVFIVLPFISTWLLGKIIQLSYLLFNMLPKNVYK
jgi:hypothetical protein